jgi:hypothetical protein
MPLPPVTDCAKVVAEYELSSVPVVNVWHVHQSGGWSLPTLTTLEGYFHSWLTLEVLPDLSQDLILKKITCTDLGVVAGAQYIGTHSDAGGDPTDSAPANVALVLSWRTPYIGRSFRGRSYMPGIPAHTVIDPQHVDPSEASGLQTAGNDLLTLLAGHTIELVVVSYFSAGAPRVTPIATPITRCICNNTIDTQRKRIKQ